MRGTWRVYTIPAIAAFVGIGLSLFVYHRVEQYEQQRVATEFQRRTENISRVLTSGIEGYTNLVQSYANQTAVFSRRRLRNAGAAELLLIQSEWETAQPGIQQTVQDARAHFPGIRAIGWALRVPRENLETFEAAARLLVSPEYRVRELGPDRGYRPVGERVEYVPVFYAQPDEDFQRLMGIDLSESAKVGEALKDAAAQRATIASEPIRVIRDITGQLGVFMVAPAYREGAHPPSTDERLGSVMTWLFAVVLVDDLLNSALAGLDEPGIDFFVFPGPEDTSPRSLTSQPVYASNGDPASLAGFRQADYAAEYARQSVIEVAGKAWDIHFFPKPSFVRTYSTRMPETVLAFSCAFALIVSGYLAFFIGRAERVSRLVAERTRDLERANEALEAEIDMRRLAESEKRGLESQLYQAQRMDSIGNLAGGIAHDFNNILLAVLGYIELSSAQEGLPGKVATYLDSAKSAGERAVTLTQQLLAFGRRQTLEIAPHDMNEIVAGFEKILERIVPENIKYTFHRCGSPCVVLGDAGQLEQVVLNLVVNACEAMPDGGELTVAIETVELAGRELAGKPSMAPGPYVRLTVSDTGAGIEEQDLDRIFEPFYSTKSHRQGTGLGLAVVYGIVQQHGGCVEADSRPGEGSVFTVHLPQSREAVSRRAAEQPAPFGGGYETILVAEDEREVREFAQLVLEQAGYSVQTAADGREALELFEQHRNEIALVFADVVMPGMGGRELSAAVRKIDATVPVILTSGYLGHDDEQYFLNQDVSFLPKPYSPVVLRTEVRRALDLPAAPAPAPTAE